MAVTFTAFFPEYKNKTFLQIKRKFSNVMNSSKDSLVSWPMTVLQLILFQYN